MDLGKIANRYAGALYALAVEKKEQDPVYEQMKVLAQAFISVPDLTEALSNPMYSEENKIILLATACGKKVNPLVQTFLEFVVRKGREEYMLFIAMSFLNIYRKEERIVIGNITSTVDLPRETIEKIKRFITVKYRQHLELHTEIDKNIIGGFIMEVDNYRFDASLKTKLESIKRSLIAD